MTFIMYYDTDNVEHQNDNTIISVKSTDTVFFIGTQDITLKNIFDNCNKKKNLMSRGNCMSMEIIYNTNLNRIKYK